MLDGIKAMQMFLNLIAAEPDISRVPVMIDSSKWTVAVADNGSQRSGEFTFKGSEQFSFGKQTKQENMELL